MKRILTLLTLTFCLTTAQADIFSTISKIEKFDMPTFDRLDTKEFTFGFFLAGETNPDFELNKAMKSRKANFQIRVNYPDAYKMYASGAIEDFSYFGFRLYDFETGKISFEEFLSELQNYITIYEKNEKTN